MPIYWAFLTYMLLRPGTENKEYFFMFTGLDKIVHFSIFFALGYCFRCRFPKMSKANYFYILTIYAILTEILQDQMNLGRSMEALDLLADFLGYSLAIYIYNYLKIKI